MSGSLNKVMLIGNLGDEVKMHHFDGGGCIGRFSIATNESYTNKTTGEKVTNTEWHNLVVKNKAAEVCEKYLKREIKFMLKEKLRLKNGNLKMEFKGILLKFTYLNLIFYQLKMTPILILL
jgi:single-strand DNA-binding protein